LAPGAGGRPEPPARGGAASCEPEMNHSLTAWKEAAAEAALTAFLNREIKSLGVVRELAIRTREKTLRIAVDLKGEAARLWIEAAAYELSERDGEVYLVVRGITASREWIAAALNQYVAGRAFRLPPAARFLR